MKWAVAFLLPPLIAALSYRCDNDQVLIVQSFGNDTIRMHCQRLNLCGFEHLKCTYDSLQPHCGGKTNFVAHVAQLTPTGPVTHTCCDLKMHADNPVPTHDGNDCFVYELPDGTGRSSEVKPNTEDEREYTLLKDANKIPEQFANYTGYRLQLFLLKNKSPPTLIVKGIERRPDGYRVTICRPRCKQLSNSKESGRQQESSTVSSTSTHEGILRESKGNTTATKKSEEHGSDDHSLNKSTSNGPELGTLHKETQIIKLPKVGEWIVATWSAWTTSKWASWSHREWSEYGDTSSGTRSRSDRYRIGKTDGTDSETSGASSGSGQAGATRKESSAQTAGEDGSTQKNISTDRATNNTVNIFVDGDQPSQSETNESQSGQGETSEGGTVEGRIDKSLGQGKRDKMNKNTNFITIDRTESGEGKVEGGKESESTKEVRGKEQGGSVSSSQSGEVKQSSNETSTARKEAVEGVTTPEKEANAQPAGQEKASGSTTISSSKVGEKKKETDGGNQVKEGVESSGSGSSNISTTGVEKLSSTVKQETKEKDDGKDNDGNEGAKKAETTKVQMGEKERNATSSGEKTGKESDESEIPENEEEEEGGSGEVNPNDLRKKGEHGKKEESEAGKGEQNIGKASNTEEESGASSKKAVGEGEQTGTGKATEEKKQTKDNISVEGHEGGKENGLGDKSEGIDATTTVTITTQSSGGNNVIDKEDGFKVITMKPEVDEHLSEFDKLKQEMIKALSPTLAPPANGQSNESETSAGASNVGGEAKAAAAKTQIGTSDGANKTDDKSAERGKTSGEVKEHQTVEGGSGEVASNITSEAKKAAVRLINGGITPDNSGEGPLGDLLASGGGSAAPGVTSAPAALSALTVGGGGAAPGAGGAAYGNARAFPGARAFGRGRSNCFSADTTVHTHSGLKKMKDLEVGDYVLVPASGNVLKYERVEMFYHREPETRAKFVVIETESGRSLSLTELHLLPIGRCDEMRNDIMDIQNVDEWMCKSRFAHKARHGDCVLTVGDQGRLQVDRIVKVGRQFLKGIYSPMTVEGTIVTDGILASCFSQVESHFIQKLILDVILLLHRIFGRLVISLNDPVQHLPSLIEFIHQTSRYVVPFVKY